MIKLTIFSFNVVQNPLFIISNAFAEID